MKDGDAVAGAATSNGLSRRQVWGMPVVLTVTSTAALVVGLLADGAADLVAWVGLALPVVVAAWHTVRAASHRARG